MQTRQTAQDFDGWRRVISESFVPLEADPVRTRGAFSGTVTASMLGGIGLSTVDAEAHTVRRTRQMAGDGGGGLFKLGLQLSGTGLLVQDGREVVMEPGRLALYDTSRPYTLTFDRAFTSHVMMFPHRALGVAPERAGQLTATALDADHHLGAAVTAFLRQAVDVAPDLDPAVGARLAGNVVDLLGTLVSEILGETAADAPDAAEERSRPTDRDRALAAVHEHIDAHLGDPELTPASIAQSQFMSVRSLHLLFEGTGTTVAAHIRERRLERCRAELGAAGHAGRPVAVVGARWGFADPAHFSRAFRSRYGVTPGQYRRTAA